MGARSMLRSAAAIVAALGTKVWRLRSRRPGHATVVAYGALFVALGGTALATTQAFILGATNRVNAASEVTNVKADNSQNPIASPLLTLTNLGAGTGASALGLTVASGHPPFTTNSATKVTNLNADKVDGLDSSSFVSTTGFRRVGPVTTTNATLSEVPLAKIGNFTFEGDCFRGSPNDQLEIFIASAVDHSAYGVVTQPAAGGQLGKGDMVAGTSYPIADWSGAVGTPDFNAASGSAVEPNGHQVTFDLYQAVNTRNVDGQCIFGGTFAVK